MILVDAGPLVAIIERDEPDHERCRDALASLTPPMLTTWPAFTEAMYLLGQSGWTAQEALWRLVLRGDLEIEELEARAVARARELMEQYRDLPMDLADATLVAAAETRGVRRIFTLDHDFTTYRLHGRQRFDIVP